MTDRRSTPAGAIVRIACSAELANLPALLGLVAALCRREQIDEATSQDLQLITEEACVNVMHHAYPDGQSGPLTLELQVTHPPGQRRVVLTLEDQGKAFDPLSIAAVDTASPLEARAVGGLGVHLIRQLTDRQDYQRHPLRGNVFTVEKQLRPTSPPSH